MSKLTANEIAWMKTAAVCAGLYIATGVVIRILAGDITDEE